MKSKKVTMLAVALVVGVVAVAAGIGYATTYTATTTNTDNNADAAYIVVSQDGTGKYDDDWLTKVYFDTVNESAGVNKYTLKKDWGITGNTITKNPESGATSSLISGALNIVVVGTNSTDQAFDITVSTSDLTAIEGLSYRLVIASAVDKTGNEVTAVTAITSKVVDSSTNPTKWAFTDIPATTGSAGNGNYYLLMFIEGGDGISAVPGATAGFDADSEFTIVVTANDA